jgi:hypothetical protein
MKYLLYNNKTRFFFLVTLIVVLFPIKSIAQEAQKMGRVNPNIPYTFSSERGDYTYLDGGTIVPKLSAADAVSDRLPIGFSFQFGCETYSNFYASSNGTLSFNKAFNTASNSGHSLTPTNLTLLAPFWDYLHGGNGIFSYCTTGVAPNRVFTAEWKNWKTYFGISSIISFQVKLYEGTNTIEYVYNQEPTSNTNIPTGVSIGMFNGNSFNAAAKQLWLNSSSENPTASLNLTENIFIRPASGQVYRFTHNDNEASCEAFFYGQTMINKTGGTNENDGLRITLSGAANMQVRRKNVNQISNSNNNLLIGTSNPYGSPGSVHGVALAVGNTYFAGGVLRPEDGSKTMLSVVSSTEQSRIESPSGHFVNEIKLAAVKNDLIYYLTVKYTYDFPENYFFIDYTVTIPEGNTEEVKLAHGWDTHVQNSKSLGPGFVTGVAPNLVVGAKMIGGTSYEAFEYISGVPWSGYFSAYYISMPYNLGRDMAFKNTVNPDVNIDNGLGISMNFGSTSGSFTSSNKLFFACSAGDVAPTLVNEAVICQDQTLNLNSLITSPTPPPDVAVVWKDAKGVVVTDPTAVTTAGTYTVYYRSAKYNCISPTASIEIIYDSCGVCYKPGFSTGTQTGFPLAVISMLDRKNHPAINPRNGALILESKEKGFAISKVASPETTIAVPVEGMLVFDTTSNCLKLYNGIIWNCMEQTCVDNN